MKQGEHRAGRAIAGRPTRPASARTRWLVFLFTALFALLLSSTGFAATKTIYVPQPNVSTYAIGAAGIVFTLSGCQSSTPTTATITVQPAHGTTSMTPGNLTSPSCPGQSFPGTFVFYTWTDTTGSPGSGSDAFHVHFVTPEGIVDYDIYVSEGTAQKELGDEHAGDETFGGICQDCQGGADGNDDAPEDGSSTLSTDGQVYAGEPGGASLGYMARGSSRSRGSFRRSVNPIQVGSGNVFYGYTDYTTAGANPLAFTRYYNSGAATNSIASFLSLSTSNRNWRSNFDRYIEMLNSTVLAVERPDGQVIDFFLVGSTWTPDTDVDYTLTQAGSAWTLTGPDDTVETYAGTANPLLAGFAATAQLASIKTRNGYTQTLNYTNDVLTSVTDSFGRTLSFAHNPDGSVASLTTPDNTTIAYAYTSVPLANLTLAGQQLTTVTFPTSPPQTITYNYADTGLPFALTSVTDEDGNTVESWTYDSQGRGLTNQLGNGAGVSTVVYGATTTTVTNALGVTDTYTLPLSAQGVPKVTAITRAATGTTTAATQTVTYDANGYVASRTDWNGNTTTYTNNAHGLPTSLTEGLGSAVARTVTVAYSTAFPHLPATITSAGVTRAFTYEAGTGNPLTVTLTDTTATTAPYATNAQARVWTNTWSNFLLATTKTPKGNLTTFGYDASGALTSITDALNHTTTITMHTGGGLPQVIVDPNGVMTALTYDPRQRLMASAVTTAAGTLTTSFAYDPSGNLTRTTLPDGSFIANSYDAAHRVTQIADALGNTVGLTLDALGDRTAVVVKDSGGTPRRQHATTFDALGRPLVDTAGAGQTTTLTYDPNGNALTVTDGLSHKTTRIFDALNRLATSTDANGGITTLTYDPHDRITAVKDANGHSTTYVIDGFGEVVGQTSPDTGATVYHFDPDGNLTSKLDAAGVTVNMTYDALERLLTRTFPADATQNATYAYDVSNDSTGFPVGRLGSRADATGLAAFDYDERGNVLSARSSGAPGGANLSTSYAYDRASRVAGITYPSGLTIGYGRDAQGNVASVSITPPGASAPSTIAALSTLPFGPDFQTELGNGVTESRGFDLDYRMTSVTATGTAGALENLTYTLDVANNVTAIADAVNAANNQALTYDPINRLTGATSGTGGYGSLAWVLDKVGNLTSHAAGTATTTYALAAGTNRLASITAGGVTTSVTTNANGNITSIPPANSSSPATFAYNVANRLSSVTGSPTAANFVYDDWGRRFSKTDVGGTTTTFAYGTGGTLLEEATGNAVTDYVYVNGRPLATFVPSSSSANGTPGDSGEVGLNRLRSLKRGVGAKVATAWSRTRLGDGNGAALLLFAGLLLVVLARLRKGGKRAASVLRPVAVGFFVAACTGGTGGAGGCAPSETVDAGSGPDTGADSGLVIADAQVVDSSQTPDAEADAPANADAEAGGDAGVDTGMGSESDAGQDATLAVDAGIDATASSMDSGNEVGSGGETPDAGGDSGLTLAPIPALYYLHTDHLGTPQLATDVNQNVVWSTSYQPYGTTGAVTGGITQNLRLPGQYGDSETGFNYNGFRDYMPGLGRYLEADPIGINGGIDPYLYTYANPEAAADRTGLDVRVFSLLGGHYFASVDTTTGIRLFEFAPTDNAYMMLSVVAPVPGTISEEPAGEFGAFEVPFSDVPLSNEGGNTLAAYLQGQEGVVLPYQFETIGGTNCINFAFDYVRGLAKQLHEKEELNDEDYY
jgi:RHS repeat-associated protein